MPDLVFPVFPGKMILPNPALLIPHSGPWDSWGFSYPQLCISGILGSAFCYSLPCLLSLAGWSHLFQLILWNASG